MLLQAAVIGALVVNIGRRRRAEQALAAQAEHLAASNADLERLNLSLRSEMNERRHAEEQLRQAQKIDAIGRLAGGVAHDFNNLLTVIGSYADILLETLSPLDPARPHAEHIRQATERAAGLTHQLLAFSRKQVMQPRVVDLNVVVRGLESMVGRLIGEDIQLHGAAERTAGDRRRRCRTDRAGHREPGGQRARRDARRRPAGDRDRPSVADCAMRSRTVPA